MMIQMCTSYYNRTFKLNNLLCSDSYDEKGMLFITEENDLAVCITAIKSSCETSDLLQSMSTKYQE